jgi:phage/plasmid primase-like uncharacterized protein
MEANIMANFFTDLNNYIKQNPLEYMRDFGVEIEPDKETPCPVCGGNNRFRWRTEKDKNHPNTGYCHNKSAHDGYNILQPLKIIMDVTGFRLEDIGAYIGFNNGNKRRNPKHFSMKYSRKKLEHSSKPEMPELDYNKLDLFSNNVRNESKNAIWRESPYLLTKGISKMMWVGGHGQTLLDYYRSDNTFCALQRIAPKKGEGKPDKQFIGNSQSSGAFHCERNQDGNIETIFIGEGFGTVTAFQYSISELYPASLFLTAGYDTNLIRVAIEARKYYPNAYICILTDNDSHKDNAGLKATIKTMSQVNKCWWAMPVNASEDWCDVFQRGKFAVRDEFQRVLTDRKPSI